jgi:cell wall-associated NlpC family hydrolase
MGAVLPDSYPVEPAPAWVAEYIGLPFEMGGRGPDAFDCWGLTWLVLRRHFRLTVPAFCGVVWDTDDRATRIEAGGVIKRASETHFEEVKPGRERPGDVILLRISGRPLHIGLVVLPGLMLHTADDSDSATERYDGMLWRNRVEGFYRVIPA